jgi:hypothetical protein
MILQKNTLLNFNIKTVTGLQNIAPAKLVVTSADGETRQIELNDKQVANYCCQTTGQRCNRGDAC